MSDPTPTPPVGDSASWFNYIPNPVRWLIGTALGLTAFAGYLPAPLIAGAWTFFSTPAGICALFVGSIATAVGVSAKMFEKPMNELRTEVRACHTAKEAERATFEQKLRRFTGVLLLYAKGDTAKAHEEALRLLGE